jgi:hypothetical protein
MIAWRRDYGAEKPVNIFYELRSKMPIVNSKQNLFDEPEIHPSAKPARR